MKTGVVVNNLNDHTKNPELVRAGYRLLGEAKHYQKKQKESADKIGYDIAKDVGTYFCKKARDSISVLGGIGQGRRLGDGRHRYIPGKGWVKL